MKILTYCGSLSGKKTTLGVNTAIIPKAPINMTIVPIRKNTGFLPDSVNVMNFSYQRSNMGKNLFWKVLVAGVRIKRFTIPKIPNNTRIFPKVIESPINKKAPITIVPPDTIRFRLILGLGLPTFI